MQEKKTITAYKKGLRAVILKAAMKAFTEKGIRAVKMDDIAESLAISKRTMYEIYATKEELLYEGVKTFREDRRKKFMEMGKEKDLMGGTGEAHLCPATWRADRPRLVEGSHGDEAAPVQERLCPQAASRASLGECGLDARVEDELLLTANDRVEAPYEFDRLEFPVLVGHKEGKLPSRVGVGYH